MAYFIVVQICYRAPRKHGSHQPVSFQQTFSRLSIKLQSQNQDFKFQILFITTTHSIIYSGMLYNCPCHKNRIKIVTIKIEIDFFLYKGKLYRQMDMWIGGRTT